MRRALYLLLLIAIAPARAGVVVTNDVRFYNQSTATQPIMLTAYSTPQTIGGSLVIGENILWGATNGQYSMTMDAGYYLVKFPGLARGFNITVPSSGGPYPLTSLSTNLSTFSYTNPVLGRISSHVLLGTNVTFLTNNAGLPTESLTISATAASGGTGSSLQYDDGTGSSGALQFDE